MSKRIKLWLTALFLVAVIGISVASSIAISKVEKFDALREYEKIEKTRDGLTNYKKATKAKIAKLNSEVGAKEDILVTITLSRFLDKDQLAKLAADYNIKIHHTIVRSIEDNTGLRVTSALPPSKDGLYDEELLNDMSAGHKASFKGFIEIVGYVPNEKLVAMSNDKQIFLADPSADEHLNNNPKRDFMSGLFWNLEDLGMISK